MTGGPEALRSCAFLTLEDRADFCIYDHLLFEPLARRGWRVEEIPWDRPRVDWAAFELVVIRSTWDYQKDLEAFLAVLADIASRTRLLNPVEVCRWNSHKGYLEDLAGAGVPIVPTRFAAGINEAEIHAAFGALGGARLVVKPAIGANADDAFVLSRNGESAWGEALSALSDRDSLLQPFVASVVEDGELSLFFFAGAFSHAIRKQPAPGDFRVQEEHGGLITPCTVDRETLATAEACLHACPGELLYARVDLVRLDDGRLALMEVELIEPSLYFDQDSAAPERFAEALVAMVAADES